MRSQVALRKKGYLSCEEAEFSKEEDSKFYFQMNVTFNAEIIYQEWYNVVFGCKFSSS